MNPLDIARYYVQVSFSKLFGHDLEETLANKDNETIWRLAESFSKTIGLNDVVCYLTNEMYQWSREEIAIDTLRLTGMGPAIDKVISSEKVNCQPFAMRDYLRAYFNFHPNDDPEGLDDLRPSGKPIQFPILLLRTDADGQLALLDGSHRLMELMLQGGETITAYVGRGDNSGRSRIGPSIIRELRLLYERTKDPAIIKTTRRLVADSVDGKHWVQTYWIDHVPDEAIKSIGRAILSDIH